MKNQLFIALFSLLPLAASAFDAEIDGIFYNLSGNEAEVTFYARKSTAGLVVLSEDLDKKYSGIVKIPESVTQNGITYEVTSIGENAFHRCSDLESVVIPQSVKSIGTFAFSRCSRLGTVVIPKSVTSIGSAAFSGCASIKVESGNKKYDSRDNCNAVIETATNKLISGCNNSFIPNDVTSIDGMAFMGCSGLTSITIPESVTDIGLFAFSDCYFASDSIINNSSLPENNTQDDELKKLFGDEMSGKMKGPMGIGAGDFWGAYLCDTETSDGLLIKNGKIIKCRSWAQSVMIPCSVTGIDQFAFFDCPNLTTIIIDNGVTDIGFDAFFSCNQVKHVYCYATTPPNIANGGAFNSFVYTTTLHVPTASIEAYKAQEPWSKFKDIVEMEEEASDISHPIVIKYVGYILFAILFVFFYKRMTKKEDSNYNKSLR